MSAQMNLFDFINQYQVGSMVTIYFDGWKKAKVINVNELVVLQYEDMEFGYRPEALDALGKMYYKHVTAKGG